MDRHAAERRRMVELQIQGRGLVDPRLLQAFVEVPRHIFVPSTSRNWAYDDCPLPIGFGQTISQPYIVALMTSLVELSGSDRVLEVGTGSGYQAAILGRLAGEVHTVELIPELAGRAQRLLARLGYDNVHVHQSDGSLGWEAAEPYSAILVAAAAPEVPEPLRRQLEDGGRMAIPIDRRDGYQTLVLLRCREGETTESSIASVAFVPLRGRYGRPRI
ncbi:MAG: protein-L-isoaspartate(D-aspartate) O-methyltransferase [Anaerolineales bacterium]